MDLKTTPDELFKLIGEREFVKYKQAETIKELLVQIDEMSAEIEKLREENGRLVKPADNNAV